MSFFSPSWDPFKGDWQLIGVPVPQWREYLRPTGFVLLPSRLIPASGALSASSPCRGFYYVLIYFPSAFLSLLSDLSSRLCFHALGRMDTVREVVGRGTTEQHCLKTLFLKYLSKNAKATELN